MSALIAAVASLAYLAAGWFCARWWYQCKRPVTEPLSCTTPLSCSAAYNGKHYRSCYSRPGSLIGSAAEAAAYAVLAGLTWPVVLLALVLASAAVRALGRDGRPLPEEIAAKTERLER